MEIKADIIDYMGKFEDGVLVLLSVVCDGAYSEATIFYNDKDLLLTVDESIEEKINMPIEAWVGYKDLLESILKRLIPASEVIVRLDDVDFSQFLPENNDIYIEDSDEGDGYEDEDEDFGEDTPDET